MERSADKRLTDAFVGFGDACTGHARFLVAEVDCETDASEEEEDAGLPGEGTGFVAGFGFLDGFVRGAFNG